MLDNLNPRQSQKKVVFRTGEGLHIFEVQQIVRCESESNYTKIVLREEKPLLIAKTMKDIEEMLSPFSFERTHHSHLVNLNYIKQYVSKEGGYLLMTDGTIIPVAQRKKNHIISVLESWNG